MPETAGRDRPDWAFGGRGKVPCFMVAVLAGLWVQACAPAESTLFEAAGSRRTLEGRLVGDVRHQPCPRFATAFGTRLACPKSAISDPLERLRLAALEVPRGFRSERLGDRWEQRRNQAMATLLTAQGVEDVSSAISSFRDLALQFSQDGTIASDLAVALLRRQALGGSPRDLLEAAHQAAEAIRKTPGLPEGHLNRAVALERLFQRSAAAEAWRLFLESEATGAWAEEARERLQNLTQPLEKPVPVELRASPAAKPQASAQELLQLFEASGTPDGSTYASLQLASIASRLEAEGEGTLSRGFRALGTAVASWDCAVQRPALLDAESAFEAAPLRLLAAYRRLRCDYLERDYDSLAARGATLIEEAKLASLGSVAGRIHWLLGTAELDQGHLALGEASYLEAEREFELATDASSLASIRSLIAITRRQIGDRETAWSYRFAALGEAAAIPGHPRLSSVFAQLSESALEDGYPEAALAFQAEAVDLDLNSGRPLDAVYALHDRAQLRDSLGRKALAMEDLGAARGAAARIEDRDSRELELARLDLLQAKVVADEDPAGALEHLDRALETFSARGVSHWTLEVAAQKSSALSRVGRVPEALETLSIAAETFERRRDELGNLRDQVRLFDRAKEIYQMMVHLEWKENQDALAAWAAHERSRARLLRNQLGMDQLSLADVGSALPAKGQILEILLLQDYVLLWTLDGRGLDAIEVPISRAEVLKSVSRLRRSIDTDDELGLQGASESLYDWLIRPAVAADSEDIVIIADSELRGIPFSLLKDRDSDSLLLESHSITTAASAAAFATASTTNPTRTGGSPTVLIVGDSAFDGRRYPLLSRLPAAAAEATAIASHFPGSEVLTGSSATVSAVLSTLRKHPIAHFAVHSVPRSDEPLASALLLAPDSDHQGELEARMLYDQKLPNVELVVLMSCESGLGFVSGLEGPLDLAHPFIAAGVPQVITTLWAIEDSQGAAFSKLFYEFVASGLSPTLALRQTQLEMLESSNPIHRNPRTWATFQIVGGLPPNERYSSWTSSS